MFCCAHHCTLNNFCNIPNQLNFHFYNLTFIFAINCCNIFFSRFNPDLKPISQIKACIMYVVISKYWDNFRSSQYSVLHWNEVQKLNFLICFVRFLGFCRAAGSSLKFMHIGVAPSKYGRNFQPRCCTRANQSLPPRAFVRG